MSSKILETFSAHQGIISVVGAGGKKSTILRLVCAHPGKVAITATVHTPPFRRRLNAKQVVTEPDRLFDEVRSVASRYRRVAYAHGSTKPARLRGVSLSDVSLIHSQLNFDATFVKADGARLRWLKAPDQSEPAVPPDTSVLIPVMSVRAIGQRLSGEVVHRVEEVSRIMHLKPGHRITAAHLAKLLSSKQGALKHARDATVIPVLNMVESKEDIKLARLVAEQALEETAIIDRIAIASMIREDPILEVIRR